MNTAMDLTVEELFETFAELEDWDERFEYIIELGQELPGLPDEVKTPQCKVEGCISQVWMIAQLEENDPPRVHILADSDSIIVRGLIAILLAIYSGRSPEEILSTDIQAIFARIGLEQHLSHNRRNGLHAMVQRIRDLAQQAQASANE